MSDENHLSLYTCNLANTIYVYIACSCTTQSWNLLIKSEHLNVLIITLFTNKTNTITIHILRSLSKIIRLTKTSSVYHKITSSRNCFKIKQQKCETSIRNIIPTSLFSLITILTMTCYKKHQVCSTK